MVDFATIRAGMQGVYERQAARFDAERETSRLETAWLARVRTMAAPNAAVLDLGCGSGVPVARWFIERGHDVTGIDYARAMIDIAAARFPGADWRVADMRTLDLGARYGALVSWHAFFHLTADDQRAALTGFAAHAEPGAPLLLTVGPQAGEVLGHVGGEPVYHASLDQADYAAALDAAGFDVIDFQAEDVNAGGASVLLARRRARPVRG